MFLPKESFGTHARYMSPYMSSHISEKPVLEPVQLRQDDQPQPPTRRIQQSWVAESALFIIDVLEIIHIGRPLLPGPIALDVVESVIRLDQVRFPCWSH